MTLTEFFLKEVEYEKENILDYDASECSIKFKNNELAGRFIAKHFMEMPEGLNAQLWGGEDTVYIFEEN